VTLYTSSTALPNGGFAVQVKVVYSDGTSTGAASGACGTVTTNSTPSASGTRANTYTGCTSAPPPAWTMRAASVPLYGAGFSSPGETITRVTMTVGGVTGTCSMPCSSF